MSKSNAGGALEKALEAMRAGKDLSGRQRRLVKEAAEGMIDNFMRSVGFDDPSAFTNDLGVRALTFGSAEGVAFVEEYEKVLYLHAEAIVMPVPSDHELILPLYRELLELNLDIPGTCRFAVRQDMVVVVATEELAVIRDDSDFARHIHMVMTYTDAMDNDLVKRYGGTARKRPARRR